jgi:hypothetical protein
MAESLFVDDFDPSASVSDLTELTENPETGSIRPQSQSTTSISDEPKRKKKRLNEELWSHTRLPTEKEPVRN